MYAKKNSGKKVVVALLAIVLLIGCTIGGTVAYLMVQTKPVQNTFVAGKVGTLTLTESKEDAITNSNGDYLIIPGLPIAKAPKVNYESEDNNDVNVIVFIKVEGDDWVYDADTNTYTSTNTGLRWEVADGWKPVALETYPGVFYYNNVIVSGKSLENISIINNDQIPVPSDYVSSNEAGSLTFTAYAAQTASLGTAEQVWKATFGETTTPNP